MLRVCEKDKIRRWAGRVHPRRRIGDAVGVCLPSALCPTAPLDQTRNLPDGQRAAAQLVTPAASAVLRHRRCATGAMQVGVTTAVAATHQPRVIPRSASPFTAAVCCVSGLCPGSSASRRAAIKP